jgi:hypothetical protein
MADTTESASVLGLNQQVFMIGFMGGMASGAGKFTIGFCPSPVLHSSVRNSAVHSLSVLFTY